MYWYALNVSRMLTDRAESASVAMPGSQCPLTRTNKHKKAVIKNQCNLGTRINKLENAGLRTPLKIFLGSGLHSQKKD